MPQKVLTEPVGFVADCRPKFRFAKHSLSVSTVVMIDPMLLVGGSWMDDEMVSIEVLGDVPYVNM